MGRQNMTLYRKKTKWQILSPRHRTRLSYKLFLSPQNRAFKALAHSYASDEVSEIDPRIAANFDEYTIVEWGLKNEATEYDIV